MVKRINRLARTREAGTSIVEMTIVLPLLLILVFAIGEFGIAYTRWVSLTNATREGARVGVVFRNPCDSGTVDSEIIATVENFADSSGLDPATIITTPVGACLGTGTQLTVTTAVPYNYLALPALAGLAPTSWLRARTVMRNE
jgi:Flp pilus assembly protein TadG